MVDSSSCSVCEGNQTHCLFWSLTRVKCSETIKLSRHCSHCADQPIEPTWLLTLDIDMEPLVRQRRTTAALLLQFYYKEKARRKPQPQMAGKHRHYGLSGLTWSRKPSSEIMLQIPQQTETPLTSFTRKKAFSKQGHFI